MEPDIFQKQAQSIIRSLEFRLGEHLRSLNNQYLDDSVQFIDERVADKVSDIRAEHQKLKQQVEVLEETKRAQEVAIFRLASDKKRIMDSLNEQSKVIETGFKEAYSQGFAAGKHATIIVTEE